MYELTNHAKLRIAERALTDEEVAAALAGRVIANDTNTWHYDRHSRTVLVTSGDKVLTAFRMLRKQVKRQLSR